MRAEVTTGLSALAMPSVIIPSPFSSVALESSGSRAAVQCSPRPLAPDNRTGGVGERPWPLRRNTRLGGASWEAIMCPSCRTASLPSSPGRLRGRGLETPAQAAERARFDLALVAVLSDGGLRRSEASSLTWGDVQRWDDGSGRITVIRSKTDVEAQGAVVAITPAAMKALDAIRPAGVASSKKVFGLSESQIARRVKVIAKAAGLANWEFFSGHSGRVGMARRMAQNGAPTHEIERQGRWKQGGGMVGRYTRGESAGSALRYL